MGNGYSKCIFLGNLGADPEVRFLDGGSQVCNFSLAIGEKYTDSKGQKQERTEWVRVSVWGKQAESCGQYLAKGRAVLVEGRLRTSEREVDGQKRQYVECVAQAVRFLDKPKGGDQPPEAAPAQPRQAPQMRQRQAQNAAPDIQDDDVPW